jgi:hypothetical protein
MSQPSHDNELSVIEDLDPEPSGRARLVRAQEVVVGVLLLLGVLGWAGWQWWQGESQRSNYERGRQAVIEQRWDEARSHFKAAEGYKDASTRAEDAEKKIEERNKQYELASVHADAGQWAVALKAAQDTVAIQPHYSDIDALLAEAEKQVYRGALNGSVALRLLEDPGLYYRQPDNWVRLENSDRWSDVRGYGRGGIVLYDAPGPGWTPQPTPTSTPEVDGIPFEQEEGSPHLEGRQLMATLFQGAVGPRFEKLSLDPARYDYYNMGDVGVWGIRFSDALRMYPGLPLFGMFAGSEVAYEAYGSGITSTINVPYNTVLLDFGVDAGHLLLARFDPDAPGTGGLELFASGPDGTQLRLIYTTTNSITNARFSSDERYVLVTTIENTEGGNGKMAVVLLDLEGNEEPITLIEAAAKVTKTKTSLNWNESTGLSAYFLRRGHFANKVLVTISNPSTGTEVKLIDPEHPPWSRTVAQVPTTSFYMQTYEQPDGNSLVIYASPKEFVSSPGSGEPFTGTLSIAKYDVALAQWTYVPVRVTTYKEAVLTPGLKAEYSPNFSSFTLVGDRLVYAAYLFSSKTYTTTFYSVPVDDLDSKQPALTELFQVVQLPQVRFTYESWFPGPNMFVYTDEQHALHARTYDGVIDLVLERGVEFVRSNWLFGY